MADVNSEPEAHRTVSALVGRLNSEDLRNNSRGNRLSALDYDIGIESRVEDRAKSAESNFDLASQKAIYESLERTIESVDNRQDLFVRLTTKLDKFFAIHKASFAGFDKDKDLMRVPIVLQEGEIRSGLILSFAGEKSMMKNVLESGNIYIEDFPRQAVGNIVERKLLLLDRSNSLSIIPLCHNGIALGTLNFASPAPFAFSIFTSHLFDYLFMKVAERLALLKS